MDYEKLVSDLHAACGKVQDEVNELYRILPDSLRADMKKFHELLAWGDFFLPATLKGRTPYLVWSLQAKRGSDNFFACLCDNGGEFGFFPAHPLPIYRRTPAGWGVQQENLLNMLARVDKRMESPDDIRNVFQQIARLCAEVPERLKSFIFGKLEGSGNEAKCFFQCALNLRATLRREQELAVAEKELRRSAHREIREIAKGLRETKSFTKSKALWALRERCDRLAARLDPMPIEWWD